LHARLHFGAGMLVWLQGAASGCCCQTGLPLQGAVLLSGWGVRFGAGLRGAVRLLRGLEMACWCRCTVPQDPQGAASGC